MRCWCGGASGPQRPSISCCSSQRAGPFFHVSSLGLAVSSMSEEDVPECRICRCSAEESGEQLYAPCACKGSLQWVHPSCLEQWRQASPNVASRMRCDMCHTEFLLEQQRPGLGEICRPCSTGALRFLVAAVAVEIATVTSGYCVNAIAFLTGVPPGHYTFHPGFDLHLTGWTLLLPEATVWTLVRKMRASHLALVEANPGYDSSWWSRQLFERLNAPCCALAVFTLVLVAFVIPMGYVGKALIWVTNHGWEGLDDTEREQGGVAGLSSHGEVSWALDPAHFYIASMVFCICSFVAYLIIMAVLLARQYPDRFRCCKIIAALVAFEIFVIIGGYVVKILAVVTGVYGRSADSHYATGDLTDAASAGAGSVGGVASDGSVSGLPDGVTSRQTGWAAVDWTTDWNHHVLSLTAWMPVVHSIFFLQRIRAAFPRWKEAYPRTPCIGCFTPLLETWSTRRASAVVALLTVLLIHALGLGGKLVLAIAFGVPMRPDARPIEGDNSDALRHDDDEPVPVSTEGADQDVPKGTYADDAGVAAEDEELVFGWGTDYTHYFIGFVLLYVCAGCCAGCCVLYARYKTLENSAASTVVGSPPVPAAHRQPPESEATGHAGTTARP